MRRTAALLLLVAALVGCSGSDDPKTANVQSGSTMNAHGWSSGKINVYGNVINVGDGDAENVTITFQFRTKSTDNEFLKASRNIGTVMAGERVDFDFYFYGPKIKNLSDVAWRYSITWDEKE